MNYRFGRKKKSKIYFLMRARARGIDFFFYLKTKKIGKKESFKLVKIHFEKLVSEVRKSEKLTLEVSI